MWVDYRNMCVVTVQRVYKICEVLKDFSKIIPDGDLYGPYRIPENP